MNQEFKYSYEDLVNSSNEMMNFTTTFDNQIADLLDTTRAMSSNYQSEKATEIANAISTVAEDAEDFKNAIKEFARVIGTEIAPTYKAIEEQAAANAEGVYGA